MKAFSGTSLDSLDSFSLTDIPSPEPAAGQVRIRVEAAALGFVDGLLVQGRYQIRPGLPYIPGGEIAGVIDAVGAGVSTFAPGDRVVTWQLGGGMAEMLVADASEVEPLEEGVPAVSAAGMLVDYQTAHYALFECTRLRAGERVLVLGASGGVGAAAVQLAARAGAHVIAAASTQAKRDAAIRLGARAAIDYRQANWRDELKAKAPGGMVDVVFDPVGGDSFEPAFRSLAKSGRHLVVGFAGGRIPSLPVNLALLKSASLIGVDIRHFQAIAPARARQVRQALFRMLAAGLIEPPETIEFNLANGKEALLATMSRERRGKVVVRVGASM